MLRSHGTLRDALAFALVSQQEAAQLAKSSMKPAVIARHALLKNVTRRPISGILCSANVNAFLKLAVKDFSGLKQTASASEEQEIEESFK